MKLKKKYLSVIASVFVLGGALGVTSAAAEGTTEEGAVVSEVAEEAVGAATASKITSMKFEGAESFPYANQRTVLSWKSLGEKVHYHHLCRWQKRNPSDLSENQIR